jgi:hypothetical protein
MLTKKEVVYKLDLEDRKPVLKFVVIETRNFATHDQAADLPDIPDIFYPISLPGMNQGTWKANCLPMAAMGAMVDAGYTAFEDIDRLDFFEEQRVEEEKKKDFSKLMKDFALKSVEILTASNAFKGPWPCDVASAILAHKEMDRRKTLAAEKMKAAYEAQNADTPS